MAINHKFEVVEKEVIFTGELENPLKLFTVTGDVMAYIVPIIKNGFSTEDAILNVGEQGKDSILYMDSKYEPKKPSAKPVSSDLYLTRNGVAETIESGIVAFYCIFAKLSVDGAVLSAE